MPAPSEPLEGVRYKWVPGCPDGWHDNFMAGTFVSPDGKIISATVIRDEFPILWCSVPLKPLWEQHPIFGFIRMFAECDPGIFYRRTEDYRE